MDVYQRAWASLLQRIEGKTSWGRNELKQQMLEALVEGQDSSPVLTGTAVDCQLCSQPLGAERGQQVHAECANKEPMLGEARLERLGRAALRGLSQ